ncbi:MAG TPA: hypothetical protein VKU80_09025, partial [Planctomycetota bacterium]|nr:hypothetical protein [Planctomycetota bacterium]
GLSKILGVVVAVITASSALAVLLVPPSPHELVPRRQAEAQRMIDALTREAWNYYHDHGEFPPGDGIGTAELVRALGQKSSSGDPYMMFVPEMLTSGGDLRNPVAPETAILFYRNNRTASYPGQRIHNGQGFDLWGDSANGVRAGVNNWDSVVSSP